MSAREPFTVVGLYPDNLDVAVLHMYGPNAQAVRKRARYHVSRENGYTEKEARQHPMKFVVCAVFPGHLDSLADDGGVHGILEALR